MTGYDRMLKSTHMVTNGQLDSATEETPPPTRSHKNKPLYPAGGNGPHSAPRSADAGQGTITKAATRNRFKAISDADGEKVSI